MAKNEIIVNGVAVEAAGCVTECTNLRRRGDVGGLIPVGVPLTVAQTDKRPIGVDSAGRVIAISEGSISIFNPDGTEHVALNADIGPAGDGANLAVDGGDHIVMTGSGPIVIGADGSVVSEDDRYPTLQIQAVEVAMHSVTLPARNLKGEYNSRTSRLDSNDTATLTRDMLDAYSGAMASARAAGTMTGDRLAGYRLIDAKGRLLYASPPLLVGAGEGSLTVERRLTTGTAGTCSVGESTVSYPCFRLNVAVGSAGETDWGRVAAVEIVMTPAVYPVDFNCSAESRIAVNSATEATLTLSLPGTSLSGGGALRRGRLERMAGIWSRMAARVVRLSVDDVSAAGGVVVSSHFEGDFENHVASTDRLTAPSGAADVTDPVLSLLSPPHRFRAAAAARNGATVAWGNITARPAPPFVPEAYAVEVAAKPWRGYVAVEFKDGERVVSDTVALNGCPTRLSGLLTYPHPSARRMEITIMSEGRRVSHRVNLRPTADRTAAYWLSDDCNSVDLTADYDNEAFVIPPSTEIVTRLPGMAVVAAITDPLRPLAAVSCSAGEIKAITAASRSDTGLNYSRTGFYIFATDGISRLTVGRGITSVNCALIDPRGMESREAVAVAPDRVFAIAGSDLIAVSSSRVSTLRRVGKGACALGYSPAFAELWIAGENGEVSVVDRWGGLSARTDIAVLGMAGDSTRLYVSDGERLMNVAAETEPTGSVMIGWACRVEPDFRPTAMAVALTASASNLSIDLRADGGNGAAHSLTVLALGVRGQINHPLSARVVTPLRRCFNLGIKGVVAPDCKIDYFRLYYGKHNS